MKDGKRREGLSLSPLLADREEERYLSGYPSSPTVFQTLTNDSLPDTGMEFPELRHRPSPPPGGQGGADVVGQPHVQVERENPSRER